MSTTIQQDSFTDTVGTLMTAHTGDTGSTWVRMTSNASSAPPVIDDTGGRVRGNLAANVSLYSPALFTEDAGYHEAVIDVLSTGGSYGVGTRCSAGGGYFIFFGGGVARTMRLAAGAFTQLTTQAMAQTVSQRTVRIKASGTGASVLVEVLYDGGALLPYTDTSGSRIVGLGGCGFVFSNLDTNTTGFHVTSSIGVQPDAGGGGLVMSFSSPAAGFMFHRAPLMTGTAGTVTAGYSYTGGPPTTIEARLVTSSGGAALSGFDWATKVASPSGGSGTMTFSAVPTGGPYYIQQRDSATPATVVETGPVFVGARFMIAGQSPALKAFRVGDSTLTPNAQLLVTGNIGSWLAGATATMNGAIAFGNAMIAALGCPVALLDYGVDGSGLIVVSNGARWVPSGSNAYVAFKAGLDLIGGQIEGMVWAQGEGDALQHVTQSDYYTGLGTLFSTVRTDAAFANLPIVLVTLGRRTDGTLLDVDSEAIKSAQAQKCLDANIARVDRMHLPVSGDSIHQLPPGFTTIYQAGAEAMKYLHGLANQYRGPSVTSVVSVNSTTFDVNVTHHAGTDITPSTGITGFSATDPGAGGAAIAVSSAVRQTATSIRLVLASAPVALPLIRYLYGTNPTVTGAVKDNSTLTLPLEYTAGVVATDIAPPATQSLGSSSRMLGRSGSGIGARERRRA